MVRTIRFSYQEMKGKWLVLDKDELWKVAQSSREVGYFLREELEQDVALRTKGVR